MPRTYGFTLVEVLIFTVLISLIFIAMGALTTASLRAARQGENRVLATHYSEELREWLRGEKEVDWTDFVQQRMGTWCFNQEPIQTWGTAGPCGAYDIDNIFAREVDISVNGQQTQVTSGITTRWQGGAGPETVFLQTIFSVWE